MASKSKASAGKRGRTDAQRELVALFQAGRAAELKSTADRHVRRWPDFAFGWKALGVACQLLGRDPLPALRRAAGQGVLEILAHHRPDSSHTLADIRSVIVVTVICPPSSRTRWPISAITTR